MAQELEGSGLHIFVSLKNGHPHVMSHSLPHLTLTTSTRSLSPISSTSPIFPTVSPHKQDLWYSTHNLPCGVPRQSGGTTQIPSLTSYEPKSVETQAIETEAIEPEWMHLEKLVQRRPTSSHRCIPIMTQRKALQTRILKMENYEKCWLHHRICKVEKACESFRMPIEPGKSAAMIQERGASAKRTQADHSRRESLTSSSSQEPRATENPAAMFSSGTGKSIQEFYVHVCGSVKSGKISS